MVQIQSDFYPIIHPNPQATSRIRQRWSRRAYQERLHLRRLKSGSWKCDKQTSTSHQEVANEQS